MTHATESTSPQAATILRVTGQVAAPSEFTHADLASFDSAAQVADVRQYDPKRPGRAVRLSALLERVGAQPAARYLSLHASADNFHASIPLDAVRDRALLIFELDGQPLPVRAGGPVRFFIPDHASCRTHEIDECANVKFVDHMELTVEPGFDNRPHDEAQHAALHAREHEQK